MVNIKTTINIEINDIIKICVKYNVRLEIIFRNEFDIPPIKKDGNFINYCRIWILFDFCVDFAEKNNCFDLAITH